MDKQPLCVKSVFDRAVELAAPGERSAFLDEACAGVPELRQKVEALLTAYAAAGSFLDKPAPDLSATGGTASSSRSLEGPGDRIGPYKLLQQIGEGGMGVVFMAEQLEPVRRKVALKLIKPGMDSAQVIARFEAERQALAMMDHLNIAKVLDAGTTEGEPGRVSAGRPYFVMELVHGVPLTKYCDDNKLTLRERLELFVPVCQAIQHAHQKGIIHRDIKPSNILVTMYDDKPVPKVIDFGVAKATSQKLTEKTLFTQYGTMVGTLEYMSPEQAEMNAFGVDTRSDIYSLGVLLYELLTGTTPLERKRLREAAFDEIRRLIKEEEPPRPSVRLSTSGMLAKVAAARQTEPGKLSRLMRGELDWVVMKCLEKDRARRYETANGLARDVQRYLHDEPVEACPPAAGYRLRKFARKYRKALATAAVFAALLLVGTVVSAWLAVRARAAERDARAQRDDALEARQDAEDQRQDAAQKEAAARAEADKARAVVRLLQGMLRTAHPDATRGPNYTVRQMLDDFEARLGKRLLQRQPETEADVRNTMGSAYTNMGLVDKAEKQHRRALELYVQVHGPEHLEVARTLTDLAWNARMKPEGTKQARESLAMIRRLGVTDHDLAKALRTLAMALMHAWQSMQEAEALLREALAVAERSATGVHAWLVPTIGQELATCLNYLGHPEEAQPIAARAVAQHRLQGKDSAVLAWGLLGDSLKHLGQLAEAERPYHEALAIFRRTHGKAPDGSVSQALGRLVFVLEAQHKEEEAEAILHECLPTWKKADRTFSGEDGILIQRGDGCMYRGDYADAEGHFRRALEVIQEPRSSFDFWQTYAQFWLGASLFLQGKPEAARAALAGYGPRYRLAAQNADWPLWYETFVGLGLLMGGSGQPEELRTALQQAQRAQQRVKELGSFSQAMALFALALAHEKNGDRDRAIALLREMRRPLQPCDLFMRRLAETFLVKYLTEKGDPAAAEKVLRDVVSQRVSALPKGHPEIAAVQVNLAGFLVDQKRHADAEPLLRAAHESLNAHPQANSASLRRRRVDTLQRLAQLHDATGKKDLAAKWRQELEAAKKPAARANDGKP